MSSATDSHSRLAQLVEYQKSELMRQQVMYMQTQQPQIKPGIPAGLVGAPMPFCGSDGHSDSVATAAAAVAAAIANANMSILGSGLSGLGMLGGIDQMALLSMHRQSAAAAAAAAAVGGLPLGTGLPTAPLSIHPPGSAPSQVSCTPVQFAAM